MKKILFICTGNTCRSPMAEIILKNKIKLAGIKGVRVSSAGITANLGDGMSENSFKALKLLGLKPYGFKSKRLTAEMINKSDLVLTMTSAHKDCLKNFKNVYTIKEATGVEEISDPYGLDLKAYIRTSHEIENACNVIIKKILEIQGE